MNATSVANPNLPDPTAEPWPPKVDLFGIGLSVVDYETAVRSINLAATNGEAGLVSCYAVHAVVTLSSTTELRQIANRFDMITADGQPVRWAMNLLHRTGLRDRVYGPELMLRVCQQAAESGFSIYLYGGTPAILAKLQRQLLSKYPDLTIAGAEAPPFRPLTPAERDQVIERIQHCGAKIVFIGLGCPKQDIFADSIRNQIKIVQICVGAAFDFHAGAKAMAPKWMQAAGLEWLFRLYQEPGRLWKRYLTTNLIFLMRLALAVSHNYTSGVRMIRRGELPR